MSITDLLRFGTKRAGDAVPPSAVLHGGETVVVSKALPKMVSALSQQDAPTLVDFGPVIGSNVAFFGEQLGCKLFIEDLATDLERHTRAGTREELPAAFERRLPQADGSVDGVLCWDIFDFLERQAAQALAREIVRVLRPGGAMMAFFCTTAGKERASFTKFEIIEDGTLRHRRHHGAGGTKFVLQNRDIIRMFDGLLVSDSFLLKSNTREMLLRKRAAA
ncbi:MAG TPA: class I SAM-dependent methyltransferase [Vicinamibacterales bacterium]|nr:class I SAM-dependent methyltransferase [Vicinamibacterales bacterium]